MEVFRKADRVREPSEAYELPITPETVVLPAIRPVEVRIPVIEIKDRKSNRLITAIELLSPVNKRRPGLQPCREKRLRLQRAGVHLLEIDLLRQGARPLVHPHLPKSHYLITLTRAGQGHTLVWAVSVQEPLPVLPVPRKAPDADTFLDLVPRELGQALRDLYEQRSLEKSIDYREAPPPPAFREEETE